MVECEFEVEDLDELLEDVLKAKGELPQPRRVRPPLIEEEEREVS